MTLRDTSLTTTKVDGVHQVIIVAKFFVTIRKWTTDLQHAQPTEDFMRFLDKYVSCAVGNHHFMQWSKSNRTKNFLDKVTASDIAYTILVYENSNQVWKKNCRLGQPQERMMRGVRQRAKKKQVS